MTNRNLLKAFQEADLQANSANQVIGWLIETLEQQDSFGNLNTRHKINLEMAKKTKAELEAYLAKPIGGEA
tara:strand:+ start:463 stop:675 length:213 start_codon:yes stop_codon:yes gene_type:complete